MTWKGWLATIVIGGGIGWFIVTKPVAAAAAWHGILGGLGQVGNGFAEFLSHIV